MVLPGLVHACVCGGKPSVAEAVRDSEFVFTGKVVSKRKYGVRFKVETSWKGNSQKFIYIYTGNIRNDCDVLFRLGERWLIYAEKVPLYRSESVTSPNGVRLVARVCSRSARIRDAQEDLLELRTHENSNRVRRTVGTVRSSRDKPRDLC
jgi:hypothetical protein